MSVITLIGAGQMASALTFPLFENGHEVRLCASPLDDEIIGPAQQWWFLTKIEQTNIVGVATDEEINYDEAPTE